MSHPVHAISFEFTTIQRDVAYDCLSVLATHGTFHFNLSFGEEHTLRLGVGIAAQDIIKVLKELPMSANSGDVFDERI